MRALRIRCCSIGGPPLSGTPGLPILGMVDPRSTCPRTGGPRGSTYSRMSGPPPEQVDAHLLGYGSLARGPDGWSAGLVTSLGRARLRARAGICIAVTHYPSPPKVIQLFMAQVARSKA